MTTTVTINVEPGGNIEDAIKKLMLNPLSDFTMIIHKPNCMRINIEDGASYIVAGDIKITITEAVAKTVDHNG